MCVFDRVEPNGTRRNEMKWRDDRESERSECEEKEVKERKGEKYERYYKHLSSHTLLRRLENKRSLTYFGVRSEKLSWVKAMKKGKNENTSKVKSAPRAMDKSKIKTKVG
ncbi:uncharacterized protein LOC112493978 isoform X2 [Cephus cinctus]|uniref:Uncharacterized protein LOC112493978 isoform X2 n=1 Tax=Cephus cinctus TaxID=211228 RepID=A0AAJ7RD20_CEPCN|nr:uncharacterized protein LOC112493978 isoform X2 [Cephus cinctus]